MSGSGLIIPFLCYCDLENNSMFKVNKVPTVGSMRIFPTKGNKEES